MAIVTDKTKRWSVWCHFCDIGFESISEAQEHDKEFLNKHRRINESKREDESNKRAVSDTDLRSSS